MRTPRSASSCTTSVPTPPAAPDTATVSPAFGSTAWTAAQDVTADDVERAGDLPAQPGRLGDQLLGRHGDVRRLARARPREAEHLVAHRELGDPFTERGDDAGEVAALAGREGRGEYRSRGAAADRGLAGVDPCCADGDEHLARSRLGHRDLGDVQDVAVAVVVEADCACVGSHGGDLLRVVLVGHSGWGVAARSVVSTRPSWSIEVRESGRASRRSSSSSRTGPAVATTARPASVSSTIEERRSVGLGRRATCPRCSSRSTACSHRRR